MINKHHISDPLFKKILQSVPISTVDLVVVRGRGKKQEFLLGRRANKPYKGKWFIPGGRILWGETLEQAVNRHLRRELGIHSRHVRFISHYCFNNPPGNLGVRYYTLYHIYLIELKNNMPPKAASNEDTEIAWFKKIDKHWPLPVRKILKHVGFK